MNPLKNRNADAINTLARGDISCSSDWLDITVFLALHNAFSFLDCIADGMSRIPIHFAALLTLAKTH
jgi:hypothetical protein